MKHPLLSVYNHVHRDEYAADRVLLRHPARREPGRNRLPHHANGTSPRTEDGRGVLGRRFGCRARRDGRRRRPPRVRLPPTSRICGPTPSWRPPWRRARARFIPATASCRRTTRSPRRWNPPGSRSSAPPRTAPHVREQAHGTRGRPRRRRPARRGQRAPRLRRRRPVRGLRHRLSGDDQGGRWRRRHRDAACFDAAELRDAYDRVQRLAQANFSSSGVFLERFVARARHIEVQVFGDGLGRTLSLGTRDCSLQRRNQKVVEEAPAPGLSDDVVEQLLSSSRSLASSVNYRSAGTVEFVYDVDRGEASFLEMNTRLQVEHPVTEEVTGVDLVEWMLRLARGDSSMLDGLPDSGPEISGNRRRGPHLRRGPRPRLPSQRRTTHRGRVPGSHAGRDVGRTGTEVSAYYDPMLAKVITRGADRDSGVRRARGGARRHPHLRGPDQPALAAADLRRRHGARPPSTPRSRWPICGPTGRRVDVLRAGTMTTVQDHPGRIGLWEVGIPPSGPMDDLSFQSVNTARRQSGRRAGPRMHPARAAPRVLGRHA